MLGLSTLKEATEEEQDIDQLLTVSSNILFSQKTLNRACTLQETK